jgi:3-isopropylmalate/(R)-2-methylmalate dehydratase small subunit
LNRYVGRVWRMPDNVDTDALAPGKYMKGPIALLAPHCLEAVRAEFAAQVRPGDILVAGKNFGLGSSREQAAEVLKLLGISIVLAQSFAGLFYRNCINLGLPALVCTQAGKIADGSMVQVNALEGTVALEGGQSLQAEPLPAFLWEIVQAGGLLAHLTQRIKKS